VGTYLSKNNFPCGRELPELRDLRTEAYLENWNATMTDFKKVICPARAISYLRVAVGRIRWLNWNNGLIKGWLFVWFMVKA
jgi:hypothetical protein